MFNIFKYFQKLFFTKAKVEEVKKIKIAMPSKHKVQEPNEQNTFVPVILKDSEFYDLVHKLYYSKPSNDIATYELDFYNAKTKQSYRLLVLWHNQTILAMTPNGQTFNIPGKFNKVEFLYTIQSSYCSIINYTLCKYKKTVSSTYFVQLCRQNSHLIGNTKQENIEKYNFYLGLLDYIAKREITYIVFGSGAIVLNIDGYLIDVRTSEVVLKKNLQLGKITRFKQNL